ncbi:malate synthase G [Paracoccus sp. 1_MG-2023]|uniref:malate synthase G n=1 Tax=unclassified Paracoccus (in: a-proteobacteria) TaxID=2688777 RepID=UPI001C0A2B79|nr:MULTISPECIES: malate synthase G [unclassified Paracoccus (in: a-proteobacteria)]MBU2957783.1 malate synthase G [Paracoccus sp. C2R09]MDO6667369.1 malate synthase G [Paracoccus sp. 1_MG-2023]
MSERLDRHGLSVDAQLADFIETRVLPGTGVDADRFWRGYADLIDGFAPENRALLAKREELQTQIDDWHRARGNQSWDAAAYRAFLTRIGYLVPEPAPFTIENGDIDPEIATLAGPQLVVPVSNARFALNAANARWGSLYDAMYGSDVMGPAPSGGFDADRRDAVVARVAAFLDETFPLTGGSHTAVEGYGADDQGLVATIGGQPVRLADPAAFIGTRTDGGDTGYLLRHNGLHVELVINPTDPIGAASKSGLRDVVMEAALSAIQDCEDSVAAVDAEDKTAVYANWLGLMKGDLAETFRKGGKDMTRRLQGDRVFTRPDGSELTLQGRALLLVRNVGHLMTTDAVLKDGQPTPEGMMDAMVTTACAMHDLAKTEGPRNSRCGAIYVVKPKMHGPAEADFANRIFAHVEKVLGLPANTVKLGLMDEERRTSANLAACIHAIRDRIFFINTGFLDRTGDEIHTSMQAGAFVGRDGMKSAGWLKSYEDRNVLIGLAAGMRGRAQIGKGMWAKPDAMAEMLEAKIGHPKSGATTAWVPSPTAATLHAMHYHAVDVGQVQDRMTANPLPDLDTLLTPALATEPMSQAQIERELENSAQGILGYVVRWVDQGIGCSKVPDIDDVALMEDRATCRISAQYLANWLEHGLVTTDQVEDALRRMAAKVDAQNAGDPAYRPMAPGFDGPAFQAARDLILTGTRQPSGYTEPALHARRAEAKAQG